MATSAAIIFDVGKILSTANQPAKKGYGPPDKILGHPPVERERVVMPAMDKIQQARGTFELLGAFAQVHRVLDQQARVKWGQNESSKR